MKKYKTEVLSETNNHYKSLKAKLQHMIYGIILLFVLVWKKYNQSFLCVPKTFFLFTC